jgi:hypothetical protein
VLCIRKTGKLESFDLFGGISAQHIVRCREEGHVDAVENELIP